MLDYLTLGRLLELPKSATHVRVMITPRGGAFIIDYGSPRAMESRNRCMYSHAGEPGYSQAVLTRDEAVVMAQTMLMDTPTEELRRLARERDEWNAARLAEAERQLLETKRKVAESDRRAQIRRNQDRLIAIVKCLRH